MRVTLRPARCWLFGRRFHHWRLGAYLLALGAARRRSWLLGLGALCLWGDRADSPLRHFLPR